jgi:eukaryotic-like serine/threonine-protein kinase
MAPHGQDDADPIDDPLAGSQWRALRVIGRGGMGFVVEAEHRALGKIVAVKILSGVPGAPGADAVRRFLREGQAMARLRHPNLLEVLDAGETLDGRPYLVIERLFGVSLRDEIKRRGVIPVVEALGYARQLLAGLDAAHRGRLVHRDVKPSNVFLCDPQPRAPGRLVKLIDFGIVKVEETGEAKPLTEQGAFVGTPHFVAPEQATCDKVDARTDLYATGIVLYHMLVGRGPFSHLREPVEQMQAHVRERPEPPSHYAPPRQTIPAELDRAILRAIAKRPADRFASAAEFSAVLQGIVERVSAPAVERVSAPAVERVSAPVVERVSAPAVERVSAPAVGRVSAPAAPVVYLRTEVLPRPRPPPVVEESGRASGAREDDATRKLAPPPPPARTATPRPRPNDDATLLSAPRPRVGAAVATTLAAIALSVALFVWALIALLGR